MSRSLFLLNNDNTEFTGGIISNYTTLNWNANQFTKDCKKNIYQIKSHASEFLLDQAFV